MTARSVRALALALLLGAAAAASAQDVQEAQQPAAAAEADAPAEVVRVVGKRPGPGLWKISRDGHVLWVFGAHAPLPQAMRWRADEVEGVIAQSQEYLAPPAISAKLGFFGAMTALPFAVGVKNIPDGAVLRDVLPSDVYARWQQLKHKYIGDDAAIERERPIFVADTLFTKGLEQAGLSPRPDVRRAIEQIVKKHKVRQTYSDVQVPMDSPVKMLRDFKKSGLDDVACFSATLERLETDLDAMRSRASAWSMGDVDAMAKLGYVDNKAACRMAMMNGAFVKDRAELLGMEARMRANWLANAEKALTANASTFAVLQMTDLLDAKGLLAALKERGYAVEAPQ